MGESEKADLADVDAEAAEQGRIDDAEVPPAEKLGLRAEARHRLDEEDDVPPRPEHNRE